MKTKEYDYFGYYILVAELAVKCGSLLGKTIVSFDEAEFPQHKKVMHELANEYPDVELSDMLVDNCAMQIVKDPSQFDVIVTENMFGDILSDEASMITGSIGMIPSSSLGATSCGLYEPIHGSAPDIAGKNIATTTAAVSVAGKQKVEDLYSAGTSYWKYHSVGNMELS